MVELKDGASMRGALDYRIYKGGELLEEVHDHNLVVDTGRRRLAQLIAGKSTVGVTRIGFGTGSAVEMPANTSLTNQQLIAISSSEVSGTNAIFHWALGADDLNGVNIREFGLFTGDATPVMITRQVRTSVIGKAADIRIEGTYTLYF